MKLFEYQAKELFREVGISVPAGRLIEKESDLDSALEVTGLPCVLKAQVLHGRRGKAGLIRFEDSVDACRKDLKELLNRPDGPVKVLLEQALEIERELYISVTVDAVAGKALVIGSGEGGVDIEELAAGSPEKIVRQHVDITQGIMAYQLRRVIFGMGLRGDAFKQGMKLLKSLFGLFIKNDAELVEINPLVLTKDGNLIAADAKFNIDDNVAKSREGMSLSRDQFSSDVEYEAALAGFPYLEFNGDIGLLCAGAGLTNTVYDLIIDYGGTVSNYVEFGGPNYRRAVEAMEFSLRGNPRVILVVTFGTIARADVMAEGLAEAIEKLRPGVPIVTAIRGTNEEKASEILKSVGLEPLNNTEEAVKKAIELSKRG